MRALWVFASAALLAGCEPQQSVVTEQVASGPWRERLIAIGELKPSKRQVLKVPGSDYANREIVYLLPDGSVVKKGDLVARFDAPSERDKHAEFSLELLRSALRESEAQMTAQTARAKLDSEAAGLSADYELSSRFANVDIRYLKLEDVLKYVQSLPLLEAQKALVAWRQAQADQRDAASLALVAAQRNVVAQQVSKAEQALTDLEVRAPNDGVFTLMLEWDGDKPRVGGVTVATFDFAEIPDPNSLRIKLYVPQALAAQLKPGMRMRATVAGLAEPIDTSIAEISSTPATRERSNPVKFIEVLADVPKALLASGKVAPSQAVRAEILLAEHAKAITVPNLALIQKGEAFFVQIDGEPDLRAVTLGQRGPGRSEILSGLKEGEYIVLTPDTNQPKAKDGKS